MVNTQRAQWCSSISRNDQIVMDLFIYSPKSFSEGKFLGETVKNKSIALSHLFSNKSRTKKSAVLIQQIGSDSTVGSSRSKQKDYSVFAYLGHHLAVFLILISSTSNSLSFLIRRNSHGSQEY